MDTQKLISTEKKSEVLVKERQSLVVAVIGLSVILHGVGLIGFGVWVVARHFTTPVEVVEVKQEEIKIPLQKMREQRLQAAVENAAAAKPVFQNKWVSTRPTGLQLPPLPSFDVQQAVPLDPSEMVVDQVSALTGSGGLGIGQGLGTLGSGGFGKDGKGVSFMGVKATGKRFIILFDVSSSVVNKATASGVSLAMIKKETLRFIEQLPADAAFGMIQFVRNYKPFQSELMPATLPNRDAAKQWVESQWSETGQMSRGQKGVISQSPNGLPSVLQAVIALNPDVVYLISDGQFEQTYPKDRTVPFNELEQQIESMQKQRVSPIIFQMIGFQMKEEAKNQWKSLLKKYKGGLVDIQKS
jgi:hypothetical protein